MRRSEFFSEMSKGLLHTVKEISAPFVVEDMEKLEQFTNKITGLKWVEVGKADLYKKEGTYDVFVSNKPYVILRKGQEISAYGKWCPSCSMMVQWISYDQTYKCLNCEVNLDVNEEQALALTKHPLKIVEGKLYLGKT